MEENFNFGNKIYLNNASVSLVPAVAIRAMNDFLIEYNSLGADSPMCDSYVNKKLQKTRKIISEIINCQPQEIILTQSTTDGLNIVANGLNLSPQSNIIIRGNAHEHHANYYPWLNLSKKTRINSLQIDENGFFDMSHFKSLIDVNTKLVSISHGLYNTGAILPVKQVGEVLSDTSSLYLVDAAQTVGCLDSFNVQSIKCDFAAFTGAKWLCGPMGTGIFYCKKESATLLDPIRIGGESAMIYDKDKLAYNDIPTRFQTGFRNYVGMVGLAESSEYLQHIGINNIQNKIKHLASILRQELENIDGITLHGPDNPKLRTSIVSFNTKHSPEDLVQHLEKQNIILAVREIFDKKIIRASPHFFNTESQIMKTVDTIKKLLA